MSYTEADRLKIRELGKKSLFYFAQGILRMPDLDEMHLSWCETLDGRGDPNSPDYWGPGWKRGIVAASRGFLKSSVATIAFPLHRAIYHQRVTRVIGSSFENAKLLVTDKIRNYFQGGTEHAKFLQWLYADRIPEDFEGWNDRQIAFINPDPLAYPSITVRGMDSAQEGWHGDIVVIDDPEGADAEKSVSVNIDAKRLISNCVPLLKDASGQILLVDTSHGENPLLYQLLEDKEGRIEEDNRKREWKKIFVPIVDREGNPSWPARFPRDHVEYLRSTTDGTVWETQYLLKKRVRTGSLFDYEDIEKGFARWKVRGKLIEYPVLEFDQNAWYDRGKFITRETVRTVSVAQLRFYLHVDPKHRKDTLIKRRTGTARPSLFAMMAVGVAPDGHVFVLGGYDGDHSVEEQARQVYRYYRMFGPFAVTWDPVGAQAWFKDYAEALERGRDSNFKFLETTGAWGSRRLLPALSKRLIEDDRPTEQPKEETCFQRLSPWISSRMLHFFAEDHVTLEQLRGFPDNTLYVDRVDSLAQGPPVWKPPATKEVGDLLRRENSKMLHSASKYTGYAPMLRSGPRNVTPAKNRLETFGLDK